MTIKIIFLTAMGILLPLILMVDRQDRGQDAGQGATAAAKPSQPVISATPSKAKPSTPAKAQSKSGFSPELTAKLSPMLPAGTTLDAASSGFKNHGQFVSALVASKNLGIPFADLKTAMVVKHQPLGNAIHGLKPTMIRADIDAETEKAEAQAKKDLGSKT